MTYLAHCAATGETPFARLEWLIAAAVRVPALSVLGIHYNTKQLVQFN